MSLLFIWCFMLSVLQAASYICSRFFNETGMSIDEMKLHKLLYFAQRESLIVFDDPLFADSFVAWKYGPVMLCVRDALKYGPIEALIPENELEKFKVVFDSVFSRYAGRSSWSLSILSHGEYSWQKARVGLSPDENGNHRMELEDIRRDANRIKFRRELIG